MTTCCKQAGAEQGLTRVGLGCCWGCSWVGIGLGLGLDETRGDIGIDAFSHMHGSCWGWRGNYFCGPFML